MQGLVKLFASTAKLGLPTASAAAARKWVTAAQAMMQQWAAFVEDFLGKLALCEHTTQELVQTGFQELQETVSQSTKSHAIYAFASYTPAISTYSLLPLSVSVIVYSSIPRTVLNIRQVS